MVLNLISWLYIVILSALYGYGFIEIFKSTLKLEKKGNVSPFLLLFLGIVIISIITAYLSLFIPIKLFANLLILIGAIILLIAYRQILLTEALHIINNLKNSDKILLTIASLFGLLILFQSSVGPFHYDTGLYHAQAVKWIENYPVIPGLGNLHYRLAYNSLIFPLFALFNFSFIFPNGLHSLNGIILLIAVLFSVSSVSELWKRRLNFSSVARFLMIIPLLGLIYDESILSSHLGSFSSDLPTAVFSLIIVVAMIQYLESDLNILGIIVVLLSAFVVTIKLSSLPLLLLSLYILFRYFLNKNHKLLIFAILSIILIFIPYFMRNIILSGYLIYPFPQLYFSSLDWKMPTDIVLMDKQNIEQWAKIPDQYSAVIIKQGFSYWFPIWLNSNLQRFALFLFLCSIILLLINLPIIIHYRKIKKFFLKGWFLYFTMSICLMFWFLTAPLIRYGWGATLSSSLLLILPVFMVIFRIISVNISIYKICIYCYLGWSLFLASQNVKFYSSDLEFIITPMSYPTVPVTSVTLNELKVFQPTGGDQCWDSAFPCTPYLHPQLELRGKSWQNGFRIK